MKPDNWCDICIAFHDKKYSIFRCYWERYKAEIVATTLISIVIFVVILIIYNYESRRNRLMQDCLNDGHKEYQCEGILYHD